MAACFPLSIFAEDTTQDPDFSGTNLMNLENVQPSGYTTTTNPYGYDIGEPFLMVEQNELMYLNAWDNNVRQASYFSMGSESALKTFAKNKSGSSGTFSNPNYKLMQAVSFDPTGSGRRDHVAFVGVSGQDKKGYMWVIDTTKGTDSDCSQLVEIGNFSYMFDESAFKVPTYSNRSFLISWPVTLTVMARKASWSIPRSPAMPEAARFSSGIMTVTAFPNAARVTVC